MGGVRGNSVPHRVRTTTIGGPLWKAKQTHQTGTHDDIATCGVDHRPAFATAMSRLHDPSKRLLRVSPFMLASLHAAPREQPVQLSLPGGEDHGGSRERHHRLDTPLHHALCVLTRKAFLTCAPSPSCAVVLHPTVLSVISQAGTAFSTEIDLGNALQHFERRSFRVVILLSFSLSTSRHGLHCLVVAQMSRRSSRGLTSSKTASKTINGVGTS